MIDRARERLGEDRVTYVVADLQQPLPVPGWSTRSCRRRRSTGCSTTTPFREPRRGDAAGCAARGSSGGEGNIASVAAALRAMGEDFIGHKHFAGADETRRASSAGFVDVETWLHQEPSPFGDDPAVPRGDRLGDHVEGMPEEERSAVRPRGAGGCPSP